MKFYIHNSGTILKDIIGGKYIPVLAARSEIYWYYIRLDTWPDLRISEPCSVLHNAARDNYVNTGMWMEVFLPEEVTIT